jgi:integrase
MAKSTTAKATKKPEKPYPKFPLFAHATGRWAKKIRGKFHYFGPWSDPDGANALYEAQASALHAGRVPRVSSDTTTVADAANAFLSAKQKAVDTGELSQRMWDEYHDSAERLVGHFGKDRPVDDLTAEDFTDYRAKIAKGVGMLTLGKRVQNVRSLFKYAYEADLIDRPVKFGPDFKKPSATAVRREKHTKPSKDFTAAEVRSLIDAAPEPLRTMVLLGINCGFGNHDIGTLPWSTLDLKDGWIEYPRPKTAVPRRIPLWKETVAALKAWQKECRALPDSDLVFVTRWGQPYAKSGSNRSNPISQQFTKLLKKLGLVQEGRAFYGLRHTFETIAGETADQVAVNAIMGHVDASMAANYRSGVSDERLLKVTEFVRSKVFAKAPRKRRTIAE